jgi:hypothetical protein
MFRRELPAKVERSRKRLAPFSAAIVSPRIDD